MEGTPTTVRIERNSSRNDLREQVVAFLVALAVGLVIIFLHLPDKWFAASFTTVVVFLAVIYGYRRRWHYRSFWLTISVLFLIHLTLIVLIFAFLLRRRTDVGLLICVPFIFLESSILYYAVKLFDRLL